MFHSEYPEEPRGLTPGRTRHSTGRVVAQEQKAVLAKPFYYTEKDGVMQASFLGDLVCLEKHRVGSTQSPHLYRIERPIFTLR